MCVGLLLSLTLPTASIAQAPRCISQGQAASLVTFALPSLVQGVARRCANSLGPNAYLSINAEALARRYQPDADAAWPLARRTMAGFFSQLLGQPMPEEMNSDVLRMLLEPMLGKLLAKAVNIGDCGTINAAITQAAPLPGHNLGELAAMAATIADKKDKGIAGVLHICRPEPHIEPRP
ncbi:hypothetical protein FHS31_000192 [Sphingomonas vulcanisoli]|uniref:Uncharacterized protein n=1 Tax=Sphingomonas vulcanisoli TaxID=1658060 RepID=A0ABX0TS39_9SPHN|nr:hypothetical protein [Sphingomonas vulcanisoli]NIJ06610.1 hypothetical protein [Sphingomonas vulcanisoli]